MSPATEAEEEEEKKKKMMEPSSRRSPAAERSWRETMAGGEFACGKMIYQQQWSLEVQQWRRFWGRGGPVAGGESKGGQNDEQVSS